MAPSLYGKPRSLLLKVLSTGSIPLSSSLSRLTSRHAIRHLGPRYFSSQPSAQRQRAPSFAFAFDIDGVLLRSSQPIPGASESISYLKKHAIPLMLLTNGGGQTEQQRASYITKKLSLQPPYEIVPHQLVQSHTPLSELAVSHGHPSYKNKTVLILGGDQDRCRHVARSYGFNNVLIPADIFYAYPEIWPFSKQFQAHYESIAERLPQNVGSPKSGPPALQIDAIFVFNDPRDWGLDIQLTLDILLSSNGVLGTYSAKNGDPTLPNHGYQGDNQPPVYFSNPDLLWANAYPLSRLGQGGFREALIGVWKALTKSACGVEVPLKYTILGKPHRLTYEYAERRLLKQREEAFGEHGSEGAGSLETVYMIGDNPESDIKGANDYESLVGADWVSILTRTGVYQERNGRGPNVEPRVIVDDVKDGVRWALRESGWAGKLE